MNKIREERLREYAQAQAMQVPQLQDVAMKQSATIDYNIMMGKLDDPEQEANDAQ